MPNWDDLSTTPPARRQAQPSGGQKHAPVRFDDLSPTPVGTTIRPVDPRPPMPQPGTPTDWLPDFIQGPVERAGLATGLIDGSKYYGMGNYGDKAVKPTGPTIASAPPPRGAGQIFTDAMTDTFSEAGTGVNAAILRKNREHREEELIRADAQRRGLTPEQADAEVKRNAASRAAEFREIRAQREMRDAADPTWQPGGGILSNIGREAAYFGGATVGDVNPTYLIAPGSTALRRIGAQGAVNAATDVAVQADEMESGIRDNYDPAQTGMNFVFGAGFQGAGEGIAKVAPHITKWWKGDKAPTQDHGVTYPDVEDIFNPSVRPQLDGPAPRLALPAPEPRAVTPPAPRGHRAAPMRAANDAPAVTSEVAWTRMTGGGRRGGGGAEGGMTKDGKFLVSPKGAMGPAQVMPGTAPEAARLAGLPFDRVRYKTDPEYNMALGKAYFDARLKKHGGDPLKAAAAYNGGDGVVFAAERRAKKSGGSWMDHLNPETRGYVMQTMTGMSPGQASKNVKAGRQPSEFMGQANVIRSALDDAAPSPSSRSEIPMGREIEDITNSGPSRYRTDDHLSPSRADDLAGAEPQPRRFDEQDEPTPLAERADEPAPVAPRRIDDATDLETQPLRARIEEAEPVVEPRRNQPQLDAQTSYGGRYDQRATFDGENVRTTQEGYVAGQSNAPVAFRNHSEAARFAADNKLGGDFDLQAYGTDTGRVALKQRPDSTYGQESNTPVATSPNTVRQPEANGPTSNVTTARGREVETRFAVREADDLIDSSNVRFDQGLQPRDREGRKSSDTQITNIAAKLDPEQLNESRLASQGAPIVGRDSMVESGNGRVAAIRQAYDNHPERSAAYRKMVEARHPEAASMKRPVLVRERVGDMQPEERQAWVREANERDTMAMSSGEQARADASNLSDDVVGSYRGGDVSLVANREFVRRFMEKSVAKSEHNSMIDSNGDLSVDGARRVRMAMLAKAYGDPGLVAKVAEDIDTNVKAIGNALTEAAPAIMKLKADIEAGNIAPEFDIGPYIADAVRIVSDARARGDKLGDVLAQADAFNKIDPITEKLLRLMYKDEALTKAASGQRLADALKYYGEEARANVSRADQGADMFGAPPVQKSQGKILDEARNKITEQPQGGLFEGDGPAVNGRSESGDGPGNQPRDGERESPNSSSGVKFYSNPFFDPDMWKAVANMVFDGKAIKGGVRQMTQALKGTTASGALAKGMDQISRTWNGIGKGGRVTASIIYSNDGRLRGLASRFNSPTLAKLADHFEHRAGAPDGTGRTYHQATSMQINKMQGRVSGALADMMDNPAALSAIRDFIVSGKKVGAKQREAGEKIQSVLKDILAYMKSAGVDVGDVGTNYLTRIYSAKTALADRAGFLRAVENEYKIVGHDNPKAAAEALWQRVVDDGQGFDGRVDQMFSDTGNGAPTRPTKERVFDKGADERLAKYLETDLVEVLNSYIVSTTRRAEFERRFGSDGGGPTKWEQLTEKIESEIRASGKKPEGYTDIVKSVMRSNLGLFKASETTRTTVSLAHAWNQLAHMGKAVITNLADLSMGFVRTGDVRFGLGHIKDSFAEFGRGVLRLDPSDARRYAEATGILPDEMFSATLAERAGADAFGKAGTKLDPVVEKFYRATGLHQLNRSTRISAVRMGMKYIDTLVGDLGSKNARVAKRAEGYLRELGVKDVDAFKSTHSANGGRPSLAQSDFNVSFVEQYNTALARFVDDTSLAPTKAQKPTWASHPVGSLFYSLMSYSFAFNKRVIQRWGRLSGRAVKDRDPMLLKSIAIGAPVLLAMTEALDTYLRPYLMGAPKDREEETAFAHSVRLLDRSGATGGLSPFVNAALGSRYRRDFLQSMGGPIIGPAGQAIDAAMALGTSNSPNTNTAERAAAGILYDMTVAPFINGMAATTMKAPFSTAAISTTGGKGEGVIPSTKSAFIEAMAGVATADEKETEEQDFFDSSDAKSESFFSSEYKYD